MIKTLCKRLVSRGILTYLLFGVLTTAVNDFVFWVFIHFGGEDLVLIANALAFAVSVIFAYDTNKLFVFQSKSWAWQILKQEVIAF